MNNIPAPRELNNALEVAKERETALAELANKTANLAHADTKIGELQDFIKTQSAELAKVKEELKQREDRLQIDPDKIDELESAMAWKGAELSNLRAENAAKDAALCTIQAQCREIASLIVGNSGVEPNVNERCALNLLHSICALSTNPPVYVPVEVVAKLVKSIKDYFKLILISDYSGLQQLGHKIDEALALAEPFLAKGESKV